MTKRPTDGIRRLCGIVEGMRDNEFAEVTVRKAAVAEECDRLDETVEAVRQDAWDEGFEAGRQRSIEDREAAAWVRERGGIAYVKDAWNVRSNLDRQLERAQAKVERQQRHIMPEGMEWLVEAWPRFEDDSPVHFGDTALIDGEADMVEAVQLWIHGKPVIYGDGGSQQLDKGERVRRPAPKDLAADGKPLEVGQTVWRDDGERLEVLYLRPDGLVDCCGEIERPERLTHERPDSWERLEEDAWDDDCEYFGRDMNDCKGCPASRQDIDDFYCDENEKARDLVRRARALAGVSE